MKVHFSKIFAKDLRKFRESKILAKVKNIIETIENNNDVRSIDNLKKLQGQEIYYRIRLGEYRLGLKIVQNEVTFMRLLHRREIYRHFP